MSIAIANLEASIDQVATLLNSGSIGIIPTDTVYGVVVCASDETAVKKLYSLKDRRRKPGTLIAADRSQLLSLGVSDEFIAQVERWWPGPLSAVLPMAGREYLHQGVGDIAMRIPDDPTISQLLLATGPLLTSSANHPAQPGSTTIQEAWNYFHDDVDFYVDGGDLSHRSPSTIIKPNGNGAIVLFRDGAIKI